MGKRLNVLNKLINKQKSYSLKESVNLIKKSSTAKFNETIEIHIKLRGYNKNNNHQIIRGLILLPHGIGKTRKIAVCTKGEKQQEAILAGADLIGYDNLIENILNTKIDFDILIATPDAMKDLSKVANILGPRGLMPNMKSGTITSDIINAIKEIKLGRIEYKSDSYGIIHSVIGKASFEESKLIDNLKFFIKTIVKSTSINNYLKTFYISSTMGPGILVDHKD